MNYWLDLFTGTTWKEFRSAGGTVSGFRQRMRKAATKVQPGDIMLCYLTGDLSWIISDGEAGAARTALDWAISHNVPHAGWCPKGRIAEDGVIPSQYHLKKARTSEHSDRAQMNLLDSGGVAIFTLSDRLEGDSALTALLAKKHQKPCLWLNELSFRPGRRLARFLSEYQITALNVAGSRASQEPKIAAFVRATLDEMLRAFAAARKTRP